MKAAVPVGAYRGAQRGRTCVFPRRALARALSAALVCGLAVRVVDRGLGRMHRKEERHHVPEARVRLEHADDGRALDLVEHVADVELDAHMRGVRGEVHPDEVHQDVEPALRGCPELLRLVEVSQVAMGSAA